MTPGRTGANYEIGVAHLLKGEPDLALAAFANERDEEWRVKGSAMAQHDVGREAEYEVALAELIDRWGERRPSEVAQVYAWSGNADATFEWLARSVSQNEAGLRTQFLRPLYVPVHSDSRWAAFRDRVGSAESQLSAIEFQAVLPN